MCDIYGLAVTTSYAITAAGDSSVKLWDLTVTGHMLAHEFKGAHPLGAHHVAASSTARLAASAGFGGEINLWDLEEKSLKAKVEGQITPLFSMHQSLKAVAVRCGRMLGSCFVTFWG